MWGDQQIPYHNFCYQWGQISNRPIRICSHRAKQVKFYWLKISITYNKHPHSNYCSFGVSVFDVGPENVWIAGDIFLTKYFSVYDRDQDRVGLALARTDADPADKPKKDLPQRVKDNEKKILEVENELKEIDKQKIKSDFGTNGSGFEKTIPQKSNGSPSSNNENLLTTQGDELADNSERQTIPKPPKAEPMKALKMARKKSTQAQIEQILSQTSKDLNLAENSHLDLDDSNIDFEKLDKLILSNSEYEIDDEEDPREDEDY